MNGIIMKCLLQEGVKMNMNLEYVLRVIYLTYIVIHYELYRYMDIKEFKTQEKTPKVKA